MKQPPTELLLRLRQIARSTEYPSEIFHYLARQVQDEETFMDYLLTTFGDGPLWVTANRWLNGSYPGTTADKMLRLHLQETMQFWNSDLDPH